MFLYGYKDISRSKDTYVSYVPMWLQRYFQEQRHQCALCFNVVAKIFPGAKTPMRAMFLCGYKDISRSKDLCSYVVTNSQNSGAYSVFQSQRESSLAFVFVNEFLI
ncbi:hypothetical protein SAMN04515674_10484 [Pseudarcicella hirudinis]|uniref:Uncharacterized protein n=1 Tax=Pseudarcicella hirudinis TaxID=1079859 RepID=A0A1I5RJJ8_9BACT|nr:hypothetical protein SAMN04515674_10484 [Pseudarcicella hirudinis]